MSGAPSQAELDFASEQYLRDKKIHHILNGVVCELVHQKPDDVLGFIQSIIPKMKREMQAAEDAQGALAGPESRYPKSLDERPLTVVVLGASGDLAHKKTFPALFKLFNQGLLPQAMNIVGYARSAMTDEALHAKIRPGLSKNQDDPRITAFLSRVTFFKGQYTDTECFAALDVHIRKSFEVSGPGNRLFYLALPPSMFFPASKGISGAAMAVAPAWTRVIIEKPFGRDTDSSAQLTKDLSTVLDEKHIYRIDHYLGKEMVQNIMTLRFANKMFAHVWDKSCIDNVQISFKETIGTMGRGGYFDSSGIIRDVLQNHLLQVLALLAMEKPKSLDPEAVRDEKVAVLSHVRPAAVEDCVLGQYTRSVDGKEPGYLDDETVPAGSNCPTFAQTVLWIDDDRWYGVPFILKAAKAVEKKEVVIRVQFKPEIRPFGSMVNRNELVIRLQPDEAMYVKINAKNPGMTNEIHTTELDLTYGSRYGVQLPDAYESLIYEAAVGNPTNFVRSDELDAAWKIYTPLLHRIDAGEIKPEPYPFGTRGPPIADERKQTFYTRGTYEWNNTSFAR